jgi:hypothetical protein
MILLVADTSILVDLERGGLLESAFGYGWTFVVPDLLYERELADQNGAYLKSLGLGVIELTPDEVALAQQVQAERRALSLPDCFALSCALRPSHTLLSGDKALRAEALARNGTVYGLLWLLDQLEQAGLSKALLYEALQKISAHPRARLPAAEVRPRLQRWAS